MEAHHPPPSIRGTKSQGATKKKTQEEEEKVRRERLGRLKISNEEGCDKFVWAGGRRRKSRVWVQVISYAFCVCVSCWGME